MTETIDSEAVRLFNEEGSITMHDGFLRLRLATPYRAQMYGFVEGAQSDVSFAHWAPRRTGNESIWLWLMKEAGYDPLKGRTRPSRAHLFPTA
jgi:hypothetical protein